MICFENTCKNIRCTLQSQGQCSFKFLATEHQQCFCCQKDYCGQRCLQNGERILRRKKNVKKVTTIKGITNALVERQILTNYFEREERSILEVENQARYLTERVKLERNLKDPLEFFRFILFSGKQILSKILI